METRIKKTNTIKILNDNNIPYCIVVSRMFLPKKISDEIKSYDYCIIVQKEMMKKLDKLGITNFVKTKTEEDEPELKTIEIDLNDFEIELFKTLKNEDYNLAHQNKWGKIYERKNMSFQNIYKGIKN